MPKLTDHQSAEVTKMLLIGDSGTGKTGALASLAVAGYNLRILDFDNGLDYLRSELKGNAAALNRVEFISCTDKMKSLGGKLIPDGMPAAFSKALAKLDNWVDGETKLGPVSSWGSQDILVIDSLTFASTAALRHVLATAGRLGQAPQLQDWGEAMRCIEDLMALLYSDAVKCNVIITSHISYVEQEGGISKGYPSTLGQKLPPKIGRYFNTILLAKTKGSGEATKRIIRTVPDGSIPLKASAKAPAELPLETGLAEYFKLVRA